MNEWKDTDIGPNTYEYDGFYVNHVEKFSGNSHRHEMSCSNNKVNLKAIGETFEEAKKKTIEEINSFNK